MHIKVGTYSKRRYRYILFKVSGKLFVKNPKAQKCSYRSSSRSRILDLRLNGTGAGAKRNFFGSTHALPETQPREIHGKVRNLIVYMLRLQPKTSRIHIDYAIRSIWDALKVVICTLHGCYNNTVPNQRKFVKFFWKRITKLNFTYIRMGA